MVPQSFKCSAQTDPCIHNGSIMNVQVIVEIRGDPQLPHRNRFASLAPVTTQPDRVFSLGVHQEAIGSNGVAAKCFKASSRSVGTVGEGEPFDPVVSPLRDVGRARDSVAVTRPIEEKVVSRDADAGGGEVILRCFLEEVGDLRVVEEVVA